MSRIVGKISKIIYKSDNNYMVMIFKVKENDLGLENNKLDVFNVKIKT